MKNPKFSFVVIEELKLKKVHEFSNPKEAFEFGLKLGVSAKIYINDRYKGILYNDPENESDFLKDGRVHISWMKEFMEKAPDITLESVELLGNCFKFMVKEWIEKITKEQLSKKDEELEQLEVMV
jgi:hypothetical protein